MATCRRRVARWSVLAVLGLSVACAAKLPPAPVPGPARYPDYLEPTVPAELATSPALPGHERGWQLLQVGDLRNATRAFSMALKAAPDFYPSQVGLGYVAIADQDLEAAVRRFDGVLGVQPHYVPALVGRGDALLGLDRPDEARTVLETALTLDPSLSGVQRRVEVLRLRAVQESVAAARRAAQEGRTPDARDAYRRAIAASPDSAFLYRELAAVEFQQHELDAAFGSASRAAELDPSDARALVILADVHEAKGNLEEAASVLSRARALDASAVDAARLDDLHERVELARLPSEFRAIRSSPGITRGELAALVGVRLKELMESATSRAAVVMTDTRGHWAATWIQAVTRAGVMEPYPNHTFQPRARVLRGDLALTVSRLLSLIGARNPSLARRWQSARESFEDLPAAHLSYPAASRSVAAGALAKLPDNTFQLSRPVSGEEAMASIEKLEALAAGRR